MDIFSDASKNQTLQEYGRIPAEKLGHGVSLMLTVNAVSVTACIWSLLLEIAPVTKLIISLLVLCAAAAIFLYFVYRSFLRGISIPLGLIQVAHVDQVVEGAKRFYTMLFIFLGANVATVALGLITLLLHFETTHSKIL